VVGALLQPLEEAVPFVAFVAVPFVAVPFVVEFPFSFSFVPFPLVEACVFSWLPCC
jgi:hypothetical protein